MRCLYHDKFCTLSSWSQNQKSFDKAKGEGMWFPVRPSYTALGKKNRFLAFNTHPHWGCTAPSCNSQESEIPFIYRTDLTRKNFPTCTHSTSRSYREPEPNALSSRLLCSPSQPHCPILSVLAKGTFTLKIPHLFQKAVSRAVAELLENWTSLASNQNRDLFLFLLCRTKNTVFLFQSNSVCFVSLQGALFCFQPI